MELGPCVLLFDSRCHGADLWSLSCFFPAAIVSRLELDALLPLYLLCLDWI
jgi:hypothetical protein